MLFTDAFFLFYFLPATLLLGRILTIGGRLNGAFKAWVVIATLLFYAYENWLWVLLFGLVVGSSYLGTCGVASSSASLSRRLWLTVSIAIPLLLLAVFKYTNWLSAYFPFLTSLRDYIAPWFGEEGRIVLPPGISFYVFEALSYSIDVYRRKTQPARSPLNYLVFIAMFPRFIAGPIVRYTDLAGQLSGWSGMHVQRGLSLFALGFSIKCLLADQFAVFVPYAFDVARPDFFQAWIGVASYSFQLYLDFWSYSIMATGLGLCLGFMFPDNFRSPYHAVSVTRFWTQWHISLSTWLRDYLYISLGGNRGAMWRTCTNLLVTMALAGLWHGANITFVLWGAYHGALLVGERLVGETRLSRLPILVRRTVTLLLVAVGWAVFRSDSLEEAKSVVAGLAGLHGFSSQFNPLLIHDNPFAAALAALGVIFVAAGEKHLVTSQPLAHRPFSFGARYLTFVLFLIALFVSASSQEIPFLYFQF